MTVKIQGKVKFERYYNPTLKRNMYVPFIQKGAQKILFTNDDGKYVACDSIAFVKRFVNDFNNYITGVQNAINNDSNS